MSDLQYVTIEVPLFFFLVGFWVVGLILFCFGFEILLYYKLTFYKEQVGLAIHKAP